MERLTKRVGYRSEAAPLEDMDDALALQRVIDRLAAYEDTGLEPEEILDPVEMAKVAIAIKENTRLREQLAEVTAERGAAVEDMKYGIDHIGCDVCKKGQNESECNGNGCDFEWRGLRKEMGDANG